MEVPKVRFKLADIEFETRMISYFSFSSYWSKYVLKEYPKLKNLKYKKVIRNFVKEIWKEKKIRIRNQRKIFQKDWNKINDKYMITLSKVLETGWPKSRKNITALVSINPICPRFLKDWSFSIFYLKKSNLMRETVAHELLHFLYFKKWREAFPNSKEKSFDAPYLEWKLSEILTPAVLNNPKIQKIIRSRATGYDVYNKMKVGKNSINEHFNLLYKESLKKNESFEEFIKKAYKEIKKYKKVIE